MIPALRFLWLAALLAFASPGFAADAAPRHGPSWGLHGMLLFGGADGLWASHLPMFHPPHDRQVVLRIVFDDAALEARLRRELGARPAVWTLVPEKFELERLAPGAAQPLTSFRADVVEGHFERGGTPRHVGAVVRVQAVERFKALDAAAAPGREATYRPVGAGLTWFLVKDIAARPDFDHVVAVAGPRPPAAVVLPVTGALAPADDALRRAMPAGHVLRGTVYVDAEDLK
jgi:hypothetical protein